MSTSQATKFTGIHERRARLRTSRAPSSKPPPPRQLNNSSSNTLRESGNGRTETNQFRNPCRLLRSPLWRASASALPTVSSSRSSATTLRHCRGPMTATRNETGKLAALVLCGPYSYALAESLTCVTSFCGIVVWHRCVASLCGVVVVKSQDSAPNFAETGRELALCARECDEKHQWRR